MESAASSFVGCETTTTTPIPKKRKSIYKEPIKETEEGLRPRTFEEEVRECFKESSKAVAGLAGDLKDTKSTIQTLLQKILEKDEKRDEKIDKLAKELDDVQSQLKLLQEAEERRVQEEYERREQARREEAERARQEAEQARREQEEQRQREQDRVREEEEQARHAANEARAQDEVAPQTTNSEGTAPSDDDAEEEYIRRLCVNAFNSNVKVGPAILFCGSVYLISKLGMLIRSRRSS